MTVSGTRRLLARLALGVLLLCSQYMAIAHALSHAVQAAQSHLPGEPAHLHCDDCDGLIAFKVMLPADAAAAPPQSAFNPEQRATRMPSAPGAAALPVYRSRGPPLQT